MPKVTRNEKQFDFGHNRNNAFRHNTCLFIDMTLTTSDDMLHELTMQYTNICHYTSDLRINHGQDNNSQVLHVLFLSQYQIQAKAFILKAFTFSFGGGG